MHFKSEMGIPSGYIYLFVSPRTYTLIIQTYELDVRRGEAGEEEGIQMYEPDVRRGGGGGLARIDKISILWVFLKLLGSHNFSCLSKPTMNTCETISGHTGSVD